MLLFFGYVSAIYLFHIDSKKFIGELRDSNFTPYPFSGPVDDVSNALDYTIIQHNVKKGEYLRIKHPNGTQSLDVTSGSNRKDLPFIIYNQNNANSQALKLKLLHDNTFVIGYYDLCLVYNDKYRGFQSGSCNDSRLEKSKFDLYYEKNELDTYQVQETHKLPIIPTSDGHIDFDEDNLVTMSNDDYNKNDYDIHDLMHHHHHRPHAIEVSADLSKGDVTFLADDDKAIKDSGIRIGHSVWKRNKRHRNPYSGLYKHDYVDWKNFGKSNSPYYENGPKKLKKRSSSSKADENPHARKRPRRSENLYNESSDDDTSYYDEWIDGSTSSSHFDNERVHPYDDDCRYSNNKNCKKHRDHRKKRDYNWDNYLRV
ncbi:uncharacterized protein VICG_00569 [Vittaforma corneae ATCC 50505]|uniref:Uncharacterized protein n=1 Tax=Vittaforma corneae (strain ATCC 50505) TaxID=993615 RepID=L2GPN6_VITCO|nr:uncharacterized protein VICG_00569 [Vittaforma corneae ATCC 50505]ELA42470.1 hypothetical protein VICG_00569 [Vittaforma corneae ATCC 50505]